MSRLPDNETYYILGPQWEADMAFRWAYCCEYNIKPGLTVEFREVFFYDNLEMHPRDAIPDVIKKMVERRDKAFLRWSNNHQE